MSTQKFTNYTDIIDSRDAQERIDYLKKNSVDDDDKKELKSLLKLKKDYINDYGEDSWDFGAMFISDYYFTEYAQDLARDTGAIPDNLNWPSYCIDWERATDELKMDYTEIDFNDTIYWTREA